MKPDELFDLTDDERLRDLQFTKNNMVARYLYRVYTTFIACESWEGLSS